MPHISTLVMFAFIGLLIEIKCSFSKVYIGTKRVYLAYVKVESKGCYMLAREPKISTPWICCYLT